METAVQIKAFADTTQELCSLCEHLRIKYFYKGTQQNTTENNSFWIFLELASPKHSLEEMLLAMLKAIS